MNRRRAFTLVEMLVVIGVIAALISILMPGIFKVRDQASRVKCEANVRQILAACAIYQSDSEGAVPWSNWLGPEVAGYRPQGWLYQYPHGTGSTVTQNDVKTGVLFNTLGNTEIYHCPQDSTVSSYLGPPRYLTSYQMNGAACGYGRHLPSYHVMKFDADAIMFWEANPYGPPVWTCGSCYPSQGITTRHNNGGTIGCFDGHVEWMSADDFANEEEKLPGRLWCSPMTRTGT